MDFSFDLSSLTNTAGSIFSALAGVVGIVGGLSLGFGLVTYVIKVIRDLF